MGRLVVPSTSSTNPKPNGLGCSSWSGLGLQLCGTVSNPGDLSDRDSDMERDKRSLTGAGLALLLLNGQRDEAEAGGKQLTSPTLESST